MMTNKYHTTIYVGVTSDLVSRVIQHREKHFPNSFTAKYKCNKLVYFNSFDHIESAITEEKRLKGGSRQKKLDLVNEMNPRWDDLFLAEVQFW